MSILKKLWMYRKVIIDLSIVDWKKEYSETFLGFIWAIIKPTVIVLTFVYVFTFGL